MYSIVALLLPVLLFTVNGFTVNLPPSFNGVQSTPCRSSSSQLTQFMGSTVNNNDIFELPEDGMGKNRNVRQQELDDDDDEDDDVTETHTKFLQGDALYELRENVLQFRNNLRKARDDNDQIAVTKWSRAILEAQNRDAEFVYQVSLEKMYAAQNSGLVDEAEQYRLQAEEARASLPQFQLEGLWVGKYGDTFQMVNVSYVGDILVAHKVTGDKHVPKGEITFQVDLSPDKDYLEPIELNVDAAQQWGSKYLQRHSGLGQVAGSGFTNSQWLDGQLILVNQYFSFAWLPTGHQVFFGRPSPELTLKLLRDSYTATGTLSRSSTPDSSSFDDPRRYLTRCMEETELLDDEMEVSDTIFRSHDQEFYYTQEGCFE